MEDLAKLIVAKGPKKLPKVKKIAQSGHTGPDLGWENEWIVTRGALVVIANCKKPSGKNGILINNNIVRENSRPFIFILTSSNPGNDAPA